MAENFLQYYKSEIQYYKWSTEVLKFTFVFNAWYATKPNWVVNCHEDAEYKLKYDTWEKNAPKWLAEYQYLGEAMEASCRGGQGQNGT